ARVIGKNHDVGKYSGKFQRRVRGENIKVDHSTAGGQLLYKYNKNYLGLIAAYCVMGHHGGLPNGGAQNIRSADYSAMYDRLSKTVDAYDGCLTEPADVQIEPPEMMFPDTFSMFSAAFLTRFLFSALVDADFLDTEAFFRGGASLPRGGTASIADLRERMLRYVEPFLNPADKVSVLDSRRTELLRDCLGTAESESGLFTLTAPTGSGKTIASLSFALSHAAKNGLRRVIYVVPYNTVIEQNAGVFEKALGAENVLQHHSNINYDSNENDDDESNRKRLSAENWDYPLIVTSTVQFFESLFASKPSKCRKLHNIAGSVVVFDEAQMIPYPYLIPCVNAIIELVSRYGCTAVLATATQSSLGKFFSPLTPKEITGDPAELYNFLRRTEIRCIEKPLTDKELAEHLDEHEQVLCVVNTRRQAQRLFSMLRQDGSAFHLSTAMYPEHRSRVLKKIRKRLELKLPCRVVSTSIVEAGVDIDFPRVYRELAGLDSIVQAAGRCNREGDPTLGRAIVCVFKSAEHAAPRDQKTAIDTFESIAPRFDDVSSPDAIKAYFDQLFYRGGDEHLDEKKIMEMLKDGTKSFSIPFRKIAGEFKIIENDTRSVFVLLDRESEELEKRLRGGERTRQIFRELGKYSVSLHRNEISNMLNIGAIEQLDEEVLLLAGKYYNKDYGAELIPESGSALIY
ncbi:MAG: CRISPR-associated helicase Cas3', partial [Oscillospiraceae bacterium]|nr:CRISPR-associated helicase Cas3' [Oscillospiraceae bacterium]